MRQPVAIGAIGIRLGLFVPVNVPLAAVRARVSELQKYGSPIARVRARRDRDAQRFRPDDAQPSPHERSPLHLNID
jgi:hypothetical protein